MDAHDMLERVHDRESFLAFVRALATDRREAARKERELPSGPYATCDAGGWANTTIETYLDAATRWAEDWGTDRGRGLPVGPSWKAFAQLLYSGKIYE